MNASRDFEPHDLRPAPASVEAERYVIGAILIKPESLPLVSDWLAEADFTLAAHRAIWRTVEKLVAGCKPVDAVTVAESMDDADGVGFDDVIGIAQGQHTAANIVAHAEIVLERSRLRQLADLGTRIAGVALRGGSGSAELAADMAHALTGLQAVNRGGLRPAKDAFKEFFGELTRRYESGNRMFGRATPWLEVNELTHGLKGGELIVVAARPGMGKALALDTPIPTPSGWTTMGDLKVGDQVFGMDGTPVTVVDATAVMRNRKCYEVEFSGGEVIVADEQHQWLTETRAVRRGGVRESESVKTTKEIFSTLTVGDGRKNHTVRLAGALNLPDVELTIDPYLLGYWLGDGHSYSATFTVSSVDRDNFVKRVNDAGYYFSEKPYTNVSAFTVSTRPIRRGGHYVGVDSLTTRLRDAGLLQNKHIPEKYLRASIHQRKELMAGILDSDGTVDKKQGRVCLAITNERLARGFHELALSLGYRPNFTTKRVKGKSEDSSVCYMVGFMARDKPFRLERKNEKLKIATCRATKRVIVDVREIDSVPVRCIQVDASDHMYLAGKSMIPTHNSVIGFRLANFDGLRPGGRPALFSLEMTRAEFAQRETAALGNVRHEWLRAPDDKDDGAEMWTRTTAGISAGVESALLIDDTPSLTVAQIAARARRAHLQSPLSMVVVDHLHIVRIKGDNPVRELGDVSRALKALAKELNIPVVVLAQLNRGNVGRSDKRPTMSDLRGSGEIEQDADYIFLLHREDYYDEDDDTGAVEVIVGKARNASGKTIYLRNRLDVMRFDDWEGPAPVRRAPRSRGFDA